MKTIKIACAVLAASLMAACSEDRDDFNTGEGRIMLNASINSDVKVVSRTTSDELKAELGESFLLWISNPKGLAREYKGLDNVPADGVVLPTGKYVAEAWAGDSVSASWDKRWFKCYVPFDVTKSATTNVDLNLRIANVVASVKYDPSVDDVLADYTFTIYHDRGQLEYIPGATPDRGYFMMPSTDRHLHYTLTGRKKSDGSIFSRTGEIQNVKSGFEYIITVTANKESEAVGGGFLNIEVDESEIVVDANIVITLAPMINGVGYNINEEQFYNSERGHISAYVSAAADLKSVVFTSDAFPTALGIAQNDFDYVYVRDHNPTFLEQFAAKGLIFTYSHNEETDLASLKINFEDALLGSLDSGTYSFKIEATDALDHTTVRTLNIVVSNDPIILQSIEGVPGVAFARKCTVTSKIAAAGGIDPSAAHVEYRKAEAQSVVSRADAPWQQASCYIDGNLLCADIEGLDSNTKYEYRFVTPDFESAVDTFVTEGTFTLPNASFEETQGSSPILLYAGDASNMFWDSGNHGSATMSKNVTLPDTQYKHSGNQSLKLASQFVGLGFIGKFAAGNVFVGKYLKTDGTDGILGWGRDCTARPLALKGWVRYEPVAITHVADNAPAEYVKGDMDRGIIYIAILDGSLEEEFEGSTFPVVVKTKKANLQLFDKNRSDVLGYGELVLDGKTAADGLVEFNIPIKYTDCRGRSAAKIVITASASKGGDYFTGGSGSNMWIDDLELVY